MLMNDYGTLACIQPISMVYKIFLPFISVLMFNSFLVFLLQFFRILGSGNFEMCITTGREMELLHEQWKEQTRMPAWSPAMGLTM